MSGKLILEQDGGIRSALATALSAAGALAVLYAAVPAWAGTGTMPEGLAGTALTALLAYVLFRVLYGFLGRALPGKETPRAADWSVEDGVLTLDGRSIPLASIRQVHCWPNRDALGHSLPGWTVSIETAGAPGLRRAGKNELLRSLTAGPEAEASVQRLHELVQALGYGHRWPEA